MQNITEYAKLFNDAGVGIMIHDSTGKIISINKKLKELLNAEITDKISFPVDFYKISGSIQTKLDFPCEKDFNIRDESNSQNIRCIKKNGDQLWFNIISFPIIYLPEDIIEVLSFFIEIPEQKYVEEYLLNTAKNIESVIYSSNVDGSNYFFITDTITKLFGYTPKEVIQNPKLIMKRIKPKYLRNFRKFTRKLQKGERAVVEFEWMDKWGRNHFLKNSGFPVIQDGKPVKVDGIILDITREKNIQHEFERSEEKYRLLVETTNDLIFNLDSSGYFKTVNNYGALALGYKPEELIGKHFLEFISESNKSEIALFFREILKSDKIVSFEAVFLDKLGRTVFFDIQGRTIRNNNQITGMLGIGRNITLLKKDEEKLKELNSKLIEANRLISVERDRVKQKVSVLEEVNKLKSDFISNISHELRTPLASIIGFSETINLDPQMPAEMVKEFNNIILNESKRLARLINDLLDFASMESGKLEIYKSDFDVIPVLREIVKNISEAAADKNINLTVDIPEQAVMLFGDSERIKQVYFHLISNAIKFTEAGGRVTIIAQNFQKEFEVIISDTGIGIHEDEMKNIFRRFFRTESSSHSSGTGVGLGLVKQLVDLHKGLISVQSEMGKGTTFIVKLPKKNK